MEKRKKKVKGTNKSLQKTVWLWTGVGKRLRRWDTSVYQDLREKKFQGGGGRGGKKKRR